jgi:hypothetical protein
MSRLPHDSSDALLAASKAKQDVRSDASGRASAAGSPSPAVKAWRAPALTQKVGELDVRAMAARGELPINHFSCGVADAGSRLSELAGLRGLQTKVRSYWNSAGERFRPRSSAVLGQ